jgi:hypothetical protein
MGEQGTTFYVLPERHCHCIKEATHLNGLTDPHLTATIQGAITVTKSRLESTRNPRGHPPVRFECCGVTQMVK